MNYILFDDSVRDNLLPLTFTRPVADIRIGILTIREKWEKYLEVKTSTKTQNYLSEKYPTEFTIDEDNVWINASFCPNSKLVEEIRLLPSNHALFSGNILIAANSGNDKKPDLPVNSRLFEGIFKRNESNVTAMRIENVWDIFSKNGDAVNDDFKLITKGRKSHELSKTNQVIGIDHVFIEEGARVECAVLNASSGPIYIGKNTEIMEGSLIRGPFALCEHSVLKLGSKIYGPTTIGPYSKVGGEINNSVIFGYSNKAHDGFLGNSVLGEWCNIGADSNNSNLKNNYAEVKLWNYQAEKFINTGLTFCGLIMGDHSKCGINSMFNTGTVVGVNANIFGSGFPRNFIPSFSWGGAAGFSTYKLTDAFEVAKRVYERRGIEFGETDKRILSKVFELTEKYRK